MKGPAVRLSIMSEVLPKSAGPPKKPNREIFHCELTIRNPISVLSLSVLSGFSLENRGGIFLKDRFFLKIFVLMI